MFSTFVYILFVLLLEVGHGVVSYLAAEGVLMGRTVLEKCFRQTVDKLVYRFSIKSGVQEGNGSAPGNKERRSKAEDASHSGFATDRLGTPDSKIWKKKFAPLRKGAKCPG